MKNETLLVTTGRHPDDHHGVVNPPVYHASTVLRPTVAANEAAKPGHGITFYGRHGTPTTFALEEALCAIEGGTECVLYPSGLAACTGTILAFVAAGGHLLAADCVYGPTRRFCDTALKRLGVETTYFDPRIGAGIAEMFRPNTQAVFLESPGSLTFEVQDVPAIAEVAHRHGAVVLNDNTWATALFFRSFDKGVDVSIHAATKYVVGHSDAMMGAAVANPAAAERLRANWQQLGYAAAPDDVYLALRGLRTMAVRLERHQKTALELAAWIETRPEVVRVLYPALPTSPDHALWKRDFLGASGLFGVVLKPCPPAAVAAMLDGLEYFGMGASWGGYESLVLPSHPARSRTAKPWSEDGPTIRIHAGLEHVDDLRADLEEGFNRLRAAR